MTNQGESNYGRPLLEEGASFLAPVERVTPINERAANAVATYSEYLGPTLGFIEQVYCMRPLAGQDGRTLVVLRNRRKDRAVAMIYSVKELPYLTLWKNTAAEAEGYVTGIEPGTNFPNHRRIERKFGRVPRLPGGAGHQATLDFEILTTDGQIRRATDRVAIIQAQRKPVIARRPENTN
ncbi:MAG: DUF4432 family protein [Verrucomicrobia bacterium]|nr:DUF4432 family protein [Verrucomicrobiota bacterium]